MRFVQSGERKRYSVADPRDRSVGASLQSAIDRWSEHFSLVGPELIALAPIGEATERILEFNAPERLQERLELIVQGQYPSAAASELMRK